MAAGFPGEPGTYGAGAKADQTGQVVGAPALGGVNHQGGLQAQAQVEQVVVHRPHRQQGRNRGGGGVDAPIREDQDLHTGTHGSFGLAAQAADRCSQAPRPIGDPHQGGDSGGR